MTKKNEMVKSEELPQGLDVYAAPVKMPVKMRRLSLPPLIKARDVPKGAAVCGVLIAVKEGKKNKKIKNGNKLMTLQTLGENPQMFRFAEGAVIKNALAEMGGAEKLIGHVLTFTARGKGIAKPGQVAPYLFDVDVSEDKV